MSTRSRLHGEITNGAAAIFGGRSLFGDTNRFGGYPQETGFLVEFFEWLFSSTGDFFLNLFLNFGGRSFR